MGAADGKEFEGVDGLCTDMEVGWAWSEEGVGDMVKDGETQIGRGVGGGLEDKEEFEGGGGKEVTWNTGTALGFTMGDSPGVSRPPP